MLFVLNISLMNVSTYGAVIARATQSTVGFGLQLLRDIYMCYRLYLTVCQ